MTVHCPSCGQPVHVEPKATHVEISSLDYLRVRVADVIVQHRCPPQDKP